MEVGLQGVGMSREGRNIDMKTGLGWARWAQMGADGAGTAGAPSVCGAAPGPHWVLARGQRRKDDSHRLPSDAMVVAALRSAAFAGDLAAPQSPPAGPRTCLSAGAATCAVSVTRP